MNTQIANPLEALALQGLKVEIDPRTLLDYLHKDRIETYENGYVAGRMSRGMLSKKEAAAMLCVSQGTIDNLRRRGELESAEYCEQVFFKPEVLERYIQEHTNLYITIRSKIGNKQ